MQHHILQQEKNTVVFTDKGGKCWIDVRFTQEGEILNSKKYRRKDARRLWTCLRAKGFKPSE